MRKIYTLFLLIYLFDIKAQEVVKDTLKLTFIGDIMSHGPQIRAALKADGSYDYTENFYYLKPYFDHSNYVIANLETTLGVKPYHGYPQFSAPPDLALACKKAGINVLVTANNHSCDKGRRGIHKTINILDSLEIEHTGTFESIQAREQKNPLVLKRNNQVIAILNYTYGTNGLPIPRPTVVNLIQKKQIKNDLLKVKQLKPDLLIVFLHWGEQYQHHPNKNQKDLVKFLHQNGVRYIIGAHPHVIQDIVYNAQTDQLTVFSLGNFISNQRTFPRDGSMMLELSFVQKEGTDLSLSHIKVHPIWVYKFKENSKWHYQILPVEKFKHKPDYFNNNKSYQKMMKYYKHFQTYKYENLSKI